MGRKRKAQAHPVGEKRSKSNSGDYSDDYSQGYIQDYSQGYNQDYSQGYSTDYNQDYSKDYRQGYSQDYSLDTSANAMPCSSPPARVSFSLSKPTNTLASANTVLRPKAEAKNVFDTEIGRNHRRVTVKPETDVKAESANVVIKPEVQKDVSWPESEEAGGGVMLHGLKPERGGKPKNEGGDYVNHEDEKYHMREEMEEGEGKENEYYKHEKGSSKFEDDKDDFVLKTEARKRDHSNHRQHEYDENAVQTHQHASDTIYKHEDQDGSHGSYQNKETRETHYGQSSDPRIQANRRGHYQQGSDTPHKYEDQPSGSFQHDHDTLYKHPRLRGGSHIPAKDWRYKEPKNPDGSWKPMWVGRKTTTQEKREASGRLPEALAKIADEGGPRKRMTNTPEFGELVETMVEKLRKRNRESELPELVEDAELDLQDFLERKGRHRLMSEKLERRAWVLARQKIELEQRRANGDNGNAKGNQGRKR